ncbi:MAG: hypothetical protein JEZ11_22855 [Desulfobacterales bacterium]|nr:hypothetical protein [Desulfobacterales bacterium]
MGKFRESQTAKNLLLSFAGESQARNRYTYFSRQAADEGYVQIGDIFTPEQRRRKNVRPVSTLRVSLSCWERIGKESWPRGPGFGLPLEGDGILRFQFEMP